MSLAKIGNKIFEKSAVELSEQVDLKNVDTLEKLHEQAVDLIPELKKLQGWNDLYQKTENEIDKSWPKAKKALDKAESIEADLSRKLEQAYDQKNTAKKETDRILAKEESNKDFRKDIDKKWAKDGKKNSQLRKQLEQNIAAFEKAGKALGVDVKTGKYTKILDQLKRLPAG